MRENVILALNEDCSTEGSIVILTGRMLPEFFKENRGHGIIGRMLKRDEIYSFGKIILND